MLHFYLNKVFDNTHKWNEGKKISLHLHKDYVLLIGKYKYPVFDLSMKYAIISNENHNH